MSGWGFRRSLRLLAAGLVAVLAMAQSPRASAASRAPAAPQARFVVVLDAAHGGDDAGANLGNGETEKSYTLALSVKLRSMLSARGFQVVTTRESDVTIDADHRAAIANHARAQACLVLHATASGRGVHLYSSSLTPAQPTRFMPWKTAQAAWVLRSLALAGVLNSSLTDAGFHVILGRTSLPDLDSLTCPTVAVEVAPKTVSGQPLPSSLQDPEYMSHVASALAAAMVEWRSEAHP